MFFVGYNGILSNSLNSRNQIYENRSFELYSSHNNGIILNSPPILNWYRTVCHVNVCFPLCFLIVDSDSDSSLLELQRWVIFHPENKQLIILNSSSPLNCQFFLQRQQCKEKSKSYFGSYCLSDIGQWVLKLLHFALKSIVFVSQVLFTFPLRSRKFLWKN